MRGGPTDASGLPKYLDRKPSIVFWFSAASASECDWTFFKPDGTVRPDALDRPFSAVWGPCVASHELGRGVGVKVVGLQEAELVRAGAP